MKRMMRRILRCLKRIFWMLKRIFRRLKRSPHVSLTGYTMNGCPGQSARSEIPEIRMYLGDTMEVNWSIRIKYDAKRKIAKLYNQEEYIGGFPIEDGFSSVHHMDIKYKKR